jgi:uncharacterized Zn-binding protein involved in type VI secretion
MGRPVARLGDIGVPHCSPFVIATGSPDVFVNGLPLAALGDITSPHLREPPAYIFPCPLHVGVIYSASQKVFVNGRPAARIGDKLFDCTLIATGSFDVFAA